MINAIEFFRRGALLSSWFVRGVLTSIVILFVTEIIRTIRNHKVRQENFYVFRPAAKLRTGDYDLLLGQKYPPPYLSREVDGSVFENQVMEKMELGAKLLLTGKAGIGKTHMVISCAKKFRRHFLAVPKPEKVHSLKLPRKWFFFRSKVILFFDDLQDLCSAGTRLRYVLSSVAKHSRDLRVIATCRAEELAKITEEDKELFTRIQIPEWSDEEGRKLASVTGHHEAYQRYFDGTPASIVMGLYKRRQYYTELVNKKSSSRLILESLKLLFAFGIHWKLRPANATLVREISERIFDYQGRWQLDIEELEGQNFIKRIDTRIRCLDKYLIEVVRDPPKWSSTEIQTYLDKVYKILFEKEYIEELGLLGTALSYVRSFEKSIDAFTVYLERNPNDTVAYNNRGLAYFEKEKYDLAIEDFTQAIRIDPNMATAYYNRGLAYFEKEKYDLAIEDYTQAIRIDPNDAIAYNNRGNAYAKKEKYDLAIEDFTQAVRIDPNKATIYNNRGLAYFEKEEYDLAIEDFTQTIRIDPNKAILMANEGLYYLAIGSLDKAILYFRDVLGYDGKISDSPEFRRHIITQLQSLVARILLEQRQNKRR